MKALIIDDEESICEILKLYLENKKISTTYELNITDGIKTFKEKDFDIVFIDNHLPDGSGLDAIKKGAFRSKNSYIVLITGYLNGDIIVKTIKSGVNAFISKPFKFEEIEATLFKALEYTSSKYNIKDAANLITEFQINMAIDNNPSIVKSVCKIITENVIRAGFFDDEFNITLALTEIIHNAIYHGNLELDSSLKDESFTKFNNMALERMSLSPYKERKVYLSVFFDQDTLQITVEDEGKGFDWRKIDFNLSLMSVHGRGLFLTKKLFNNISWNEKGNKIILTKFKSKEIQ